MDFRNLFFVLFVKSRRTSTNKNLTHFVHLKISYGQATTGASHCITDSLSYTTCVETNKPTHRFMLKAMCMQTPLSASTTQFRYRETVPDLSFELIPCVVNAKSVDSYLICVKQSNNKRMNATKWVHHVHCIAEHEKFPTWDGHSG